MTSPIAGEREAGILGVAVSLLTECLGPLEVSAAVIESEDGNEAIETLIEQVRKFCADAKRAALLEPVGEGWQPISTSPKTSQSRLVWCPERQNIYCVSWHGEWLIFGGGASALNETPTHWMPLPQPPKTNGGDGIVSTEYLRRNLEVAKAEGIRANTKTAIERLLKMKRKPVWILVALESIRNRAEGLPKELAQWRNIAPDAPSYVKKENQ